ncbi:DUF3592 domain-containing protein [Corynebacterium pacaense]|uniref:DUF3592 domain-containing protein n=1 Tax=Corynebacterium pacaense TaxID=1816684 RepID=UPI0009BA7CDA|nr:DUF3592 domain-containing protein [Corynebacterium pacaense]
MLRHRIIRRARQLVIAMYAIALLGCAALVIGPYLNDRSIESNQGRALAQVVNVGSYRTTVDFQDDNGIYHSPATGLLYPTGLGEGQKVWVNYAIDDPDLVKVEGREWTLSVVPALSVAAVASAIAGLLWFAVGLIAGKSRNPEVF